MDLLFLWVALAGFIEPEPIDAFRANAMNIKVEMDYEAGVYDYHGSVGELKKMVKTQNGIGPTNEPQFLYKGTWSSDGKTTSYVRRTVGGKYYDKSGNTGNAADAALWVTNKFRILQFLNAKHEKERVILSKPVELYPVPCFGPWTFDNFRRFDAEFVLEKSGYSKTVHEIQYNDKPMIMETYKKSDAGLTFQSKIVYNPEEDFNPVFIRLIIGGKDSSRISDIYIVSSAKCRQGGFFPVEWYKLRYSAKDSKIVFKVDHTVNDIAFTDTPTLTRFRATQWKDLAQPVMFQSLTKSDDISTPNGYVSIKDKSKKLTMDYFGSLMRKSRAKSTRNTPPAPAIDLIDEFELYREERKYNFTGLIVGLFIVTCVLASLVFYRKMIRK